MTAYRQEALRCARLIERDGQARLRALRQTGLVPNAPRILQRDVYGWFRRVARATYALTERARQDLARFGSDGDLAGQESAPEVGYHLATAAAQAAAPARRSERCPTTW
jgi:hypothetical protein